MLFSSPRFFIFLFVTLVVLALAASVRRKKRLLAALSCFFYAAWDWRYLLLLVAISLIDYVAAARIHASTNDSVRRRWLLGSVVSNLGALAYFKYTNFFIGTWNGLFGGLGHLPHLEILLPAGISFYTFKSMSYTIDVYRRELEPCSSHLDYVTFITFFPELIAGPIVRASVFLPQMTRDIGPTRERIVSGGSLFLTGLVKKLVFADRLAAIVDPVFAEPARFDTITVWVATLGYSLQIYADFSGYSDMAIGTAKMIGYDLPENFNRPYASRDITEFWRRWHMTLSGWLRDYLYIPLGGNRGSERRTYVNLMATMLLGGLWHGASWNFVLWGALHGGALAVHRWLRARSSARLPSVIAIPVTFLFVTLAWLPFRAPSFATTGLMLAKLFGLAPGGIRFLPVAFVWLLPLIALGHWLPAVLGRAGGASALTRVLAVVDARWEADPASGARLSFGGRGVLGAFAVTTVVLVVFFFAEVSTNPFIYFQF